MTGKLVHRNATGAAGADPVQMIRDSNSPGDAVFGIRDGLGVEHVTYHSIALNPGPLNAPFVRSTYPAEWVARYLLHDYLTIDPVVRQGFETARPFFWHQLSLDRRQRELMQDAVAHGLGEAGYSIPICKGSRRALLSLNTKRALPDWVGYVERNAALLMRVAGAMDEKAALSLSADTEPGPGLAPRQRECLLWTARGKDAKAIAVILDLSEFTVRSYLRSARQRLKSSTLSEAVAKAIGAQLIAP